MRTPRKASVLDGAARIAAERRRQVAKEGYTAEHDDEHEDSALAIAAVCYAACAAGSPVYVRHDYAAGTSYNDPWPWERCSDARPYNGNVVQLAESDAQRIRLLEKAGALIAAEIDRLLRAQGADKALSDAGYNEPEPTDADAASVGGYSCTVVDEARAALGDS